MSAIFVLLRNFIFGLYLLKSKNFAKALEFRASEFILKLFDGLLLIVEAF